MDLEDITESSKIEESLTKAELQKLREKKKRKRSKKEAFVPFNPAARNDFVLHFRQRKEQRRKLGYERKKKEERQERADLKKQSKIRILKDFKKVRRETEKAIEAINNSEQKTDEKENESDSVDDDGETESEEAEKPDEKVIVFEKNDEDQDLFPSAVVTTTMGLPQQELPAKRAKREVAETDHNEKGNAKSDKQIPKKKKKRKRKGKGDKASGSGRGENKGPHKRDKKKTGKKKGKRGRK